jgi:hypothetical protein
MDIIEVLEVRASMPEPLTLEEFIALKAFVAAKLADFRLTKKSKQDRKAKAKNGYLEPACDLTKEYDGDIINPLTGYKYASHTYEYLEDICLKKGLSGIFAGRRQWQQLGYDMKLDAPSYNIGKLYGNDIEVYAVEDTIAII